MKIALIGVPLSGRTTLFDALSEGRARDGVASVPIPDPRFEALAQQAGAKKIIPAAFEWRDDLPDFNPEKPETVRQPLSLARQSNALVCVLRAFDSPYAPYHAPIDPTRDLNFWLDEFTLSDLQVIENRLERLAKLFQSHKESAADRAEHALLERMHRLVNAGESLGAVDIPHDLAPRMRGFGFLSRKPTVVVANINESMLGEETQSDLVQRLQVVCAEHALPLITLCATFERDLRPLPAAEQAEFLQMMGVVEPALPKLVRAVYERLNLQTFYTIGDDSRAWLLPKGGTALDAAATIHSDLARGFIRAEVCHADEVLAAGGWKAAQKANKVQLVGKDYVMRDGEVVYVRFNV
ncbi:MAG: ribosome-binding ATPase YchF [Fimbriimonadales bacterium]|nr:MAG: ribosome-binding ATPase YchF [Fimbriimonadales bacterium]